MRSLTLFNFYIFAVVSLLSCFSVIGADFAPNTLLLIGRFEQGGANFERAKYPVRNIKAGSIWYVSPGSRGNASIPEFFPCEIPSTEPQQFGIVMIEKGTLNEVAITASSLAYSKTAIVADEPKNSCFTTEEEQRFESLKAEREIYWQKWDSLKKRRDQLSIDIAQEAVNLNLLEESIEHGNVFYRIIGKDKKTTYSPLTVAGFLIGKRGNNVVPRADEYTKIEADVAAEFEKMDAVDRQTYLLYKRQDAYECQAEAPSQRTTTVSVADAVPPNVVSEQIKKFVNAAWNLVLPGGLLIVFSGDARIEGTELADGISSSFLLSKSDVIEEFSFDSQENEGEYYFANPVLPALSNIYGWTGRRDAGSYFVVHKR